MESKSAYRDATPENARGDFVRAALIMACPAFLTKASPSQTVAEAEAEIAAPNGSQNIVAAVAVDSMVRRNVILKNLSALIAS